MFLSLWWRTIEFCFYFLNAYIAKCISVSVFFFENVFCYILKGFFSTVRLYYKKKPTDFTFGPDVGGCENNTLGLSQLSLLGASWTR